MSEKAGSQHALLPSEAWERDGGQGHTKRVYTFFPVIMRGALCVLARVLPCSGGDVSANSVESRHRSNGRPLGSRSLCELAFST